MTMHFLGSSYLAAGRDDEALQMREEVLMLRHKVLGEEHPDTLEAMHWFSTDALSVATRRIWVGNTEDYSSVVRKLFELAGNSESSDLLRRAARAACLTPTADPATYQSAVQFARKGMELGKDKPDSHRWARMALGIALRASAHFGGGRQAG